jgi:hypothetical protein
MKEERNFETKERLPEDPVRSHPSVSQGERPQEKPNLPTL